MGNRWEREAYRSGQHALTAEEVELVLRQTRTYSEHTLISLAVATGIRRGDIVRLRWADIDLDDRSIRYFEQKKRRHRVVYVSEAMAGLLRKHKAQMLGPWVFPGRSEPVYGRGHMSSRTAYNVLDRALKRAGMAPRPFHALRATCIKLCQAKGWSMAQTAEHVGDTVRVIEAHYLAPSDGEMRSVAEGRRIL